MTTVELIMELRNKQSRDNRELLDAAADKIEELYRPTGTWESKLEDRWIYAHCPFCDTIWNTKTNFCPNCGADMRENKNESKT